MSERSRRQLAEDIKRYADLSGESLRDLAEVIDGGLTPAGAVSPRSERLHAWLSRHGTASPYEDPEDETQELQTVETWTDVPKAPAPVSTFHKVPVAGDDEEPIEALLDRSEAAFREKARKATAYYTPRRLEMPPGPYAIAHFGDDHLDDDGCDLPAYREAIGIVAKTPGFYGGAVGDLLNNWPLSGRLAELYGHQHATIDDGWRLAKWSMQSIPWVYRVLGNHDLWGRGGTIIRLLSDGCKIGIMAPDEVRVELKSPGIPEPLRIHVRHDFRGSSIWNPAHGPMRASKLDPWADIYVAGHRHEWVTHCEEGPDKRIRWSLRSRGFKHFDSYARGLGLHDHQYGQVVTTVVDPAHKHPHERVRVYLDVGEAAEVLTWLRHRRGF